MEKAKTEVQNFIKNTTVKIKDKKDPQIIYDIAQIATNGHNEISRIIVDYFQTLGVDGVHIYEESPKLENEIHFHRGYRIGIPYPTDKYLKKDKTEVIK